MLDARDLSLEFIQGEPHREWQPLLVGIEEFIRQILLDSNTMRKHVGSEKVLERGRHMTISCRAGSPEARTMEKDVSNCPLEALF